MIGKLNPQKKDVTVVGGGIAGLLTAFTLDRQGYHVRLIEKQKRLGGLLQTEMTPWGIAESAAHSILATDSVRRLFDDLNIELLEVNTSSKARFILRNGKMRRFPLTVCETGEVLRRIFFTRASQHLPSNQLNLAEWADLFLGQAARNYLLTPMVRGIYGAIPGKISVEAAFPLLAVPSGHSLLSFQLSRRFNAKKPTQRKPKMMSPRDGMGTLPSVLEKRLLEKLGDRLVINSPVNSLPDAGNLILTVPAYEAAKLLQSQEPRLSEALGAVEYSPLICVTVFVEREKLARIPRGVGVLVPEGEKSEVLGILFNSSSFFGRVSDDKKWISCTVMLGGSENPEKLDLSDEQIHEIIEKEFSQLFGLKGEIARSVIQRWRNAVPQYNQNLISAWRIARESWCSQPGKLLFGNYTGKVSLRGMIESLSELEVNK